MYHDNCATSNVAPGAVTSKELVLFHCAAAMRRKQTIITIGRVIVRRW